MMESSFFARFFMIIVLFSFTSAAPFINQFKSAERFLQKCGYLATVVDNAQNYNVDAVTNAIARYQHDINLPDTGTLTEETLRRMNREESTCNDAAERRRRSISVRRRWESNMITWDISSYSKWLTKSQVDETAEQAFKMWSDAANVIFKRLPGEVVDIEIAFLEGRHGDVDFGGVNKNLAHAFYPPTSQSKGVAIEGDVHLNDARMWTVNSYSGNSLLVNLLHELGHAIGIQHSTDNRDIMHNPPPTYHPNLALSENDRAAAKQLYGAPRTPSVNEPEKPAMIPSVTEAPIPSTPKVLVPRTTKRINPAPNPPRPTAAIPVPSNCITSLDAATQMQTGETYLIKDDYIWKMVDKKLVAGYPVKIGDIFPGLPSNIDSALTMPANSIEWGDMSGKTYFFKGTQVWRYTGLSFDGISTLKEEFGLDITKVDASFSLDALRRVYFIAGTHYYLMTPYEIYHALPTSSFNGFNTHATAALSESDDTFYLFGADSSYYRITPANGWSVSPGSTRVDWFNCAR